MEFANSGKHCSHTECNQQDFLPFTCDYCKRSYCLAHRTYASHGCDGDAAKDIHSIECPICLKSVVFKKNQNVDEIWNQHYANDCTKELSKAKPNQNCKNCNTKLGISNRFACNNCQLLLCLGCRMPEKHSCTNMKRTVFFNAVQSRTANANTRVNNTRVNNNNNNNNRNDNGSGNREVCPMCQSTFLDAVELISHFENVHGENSNNSNNSNNSTIDLTSNTSSNNNNQNNRGRGNRGGRGGRGKGANGRGRGNTNTTSTSSFPALGVASSQPGSFLLNRPTNSSSNSSSNSNAREVCPQCNARFHDVLRLVEHVQQMHGSSSNSSNNDSNNSSKKCRLS